MNIPRQHRFGYALAAAGFVIVFVFVLHQSESIKVADVGPRTQLAAVDASDPRLIGWWKFDDNAPNAMVADSSNAAHPGTASANTSSFSTAGKIGSAFNFSGAGQNVDTGYIWSASDPDFTVSVWFKTPSASQILFSSYNGQKGVIGGVLDNGGRPECQATDSTGYFNYTIQNRSYGDGLWHHMACVMSSGTLTMYMDGVNVHQNAGSWNGNYRGISPRSILLGGTGPEALDDVRIYSRALSAGEVSQIYSDGGGIAQTGSTGTTGTTGTTQTQTTQTTQTTAQTPVQVNTNTLPAPMNVTATALSSNQINLSWSPVPGAASYQIYRGGQPIGVSTNNSYLAQSLTAANSYNFTVAAMDATGISPNQSASVTGTTLALNALPAGYQFSVYKYEHAGQGTVTATANGSQVINCGSDCTEVLASSTSITLTAAPAAGNSVARWEDCPGATGNTCTISMPNWNMSIGVVFTTPFAPKNKLSDIIHDGMTWVWAGDSFATLETYTAYIESYFELRNPTMHLHFRNSARSGANLWDFMDQPTVNPHTAPSGAAVDYNIDGRFDRWVYGWYPDVISIAFSDNGHPSSQQLAADYKTFINNYVIPNHSTPVLLGPWPINLLGQLGSGAYMSTLSDAIDGVGNQSSLVTGTIWNKMASIMLSNFCTSMVGGICTPNPNPVNLNGLTFNTDTEHLNEAGTLAAASYALEKMGADGDVSSVTIDASTGTVTSTANVYAPALNSAVTKNQNSGVDFTRYDMRLPMAFDDLSRPVLQIDPQILNMNRYMLTVNNLSPGTYDIYIDDVKSATVDSNTLASGWNMTTMTQGPIHDQLVEVLGRIRDKEGVDRSRTTLYSPQQKSDSTNSCVPAGKNWWGVTAYNSNAGYYDSYGYRGETLVAQLANAKTMTECLDDRLWRAEQPVARTFSIRKFSNTIITDTVAPTVSITAPTNASAVSGSAVTVTAAASDLIGVAGVQFKLDGANLGAEDTAYPYSLIWDSTKAATGAHAIVAVARDAAGNIATSSVTTVTVSVPITQVSTAFKANDRVNPTQNLTNVRSTPAGTSVNTQDMSSLGTVVDGPTVASLAGVSYSWWKVDFDTGADGWVAEPFLKKNTAATTTATTTQNTATTTLPALSISAISTSTGATSATIQWTTNNPATSQVEYGLTAAYGSFTALDASLAASHSVSISDLDQGTVYHFRVASKDSKGAFASSTPDMTFTTAVPPVPGTLGLGSRVQVTADGTNAYFIKVGPALGVAQGVWNAGERGFITQGPQTVNGVTYWNVNFDTSKLVNAAPLRNDGWVDASRLAPYVTTSSAAPVGADRTVKAYAGIAQAFSVDADDVAGDMVTINFTNPASGRLILTSNLPVTQPNTSKDFNFIYVPGSGASSDSFQYTLTDGVNTSAPYRVTFNVAPVTSSTWIPPIGIPRPEFGIDDTYRMYDDPANRNTNAADHLTYSPSASGGYYTHYVDNRSGCITSGNGTAAAPLCNIPTSLPEGSVVEIHGGPYTGDQVQANSYKGTIQKPIFIRGVGMPRFAATNASKNWILSNNQGGGGQYIVVEGMSFYLFGVGRRYSHVSFRNNEVVGDQNGGGTTIADSDSNYPIIDNVIFYKNHMHDIGIWDPAITAALCAAKTIDPTTGHDYCDRDHAAMVFGWGSLMENIWVLDSDLSHSEGDSVQANAGGGGVPLDQNLHHVYIGRNQMYQNKQSAAAFKALSHLVVSQNDMWGIATSSSATGAALDFSDDGPEDAWWIFNRIHDSELGVKLNGGSGPGPYYFIGNLIYDIHNPYSTAPLAGQYGQVGQAIAHYHPAGPTYFINNTFYDMDFGLGVWTYGFTAKTGIKFSNNIMAKTTVGQMIFNQGNSFFSANNNLFQGSTADDAISIYWRGVTAKTVSAFETAAGSAWATGNRSGNPQFANPTTGDFNLKTGSPAIDAGDSTLMEQVASTFYTTFGSDIRKDFNGNNRPSGSRYDIGAIEYGATGGNQPPPAVIVSATPPVTTPPVTTPPAPTDSDADGIADPSDVCASTPAGRTVNSVGCPLPLATKFTITAAPTALSSANLNSVSGLSISNSLGKITWNVPVSIVHNNDRIDFDAVQDPPVVLAKGSVTVNSPAFPELNKRATITFYNVVLSSLAALKILREGAICETCTAATYSNGTLTFNVEGFSTYSIWDDASEPDTEIPIVSITAPAASSTVSGLVHVTVSAADDTGVVGVQYKLDGAMQNAEALNAPFDITLDASAVSNGNHTLLAVARDAANNIATSAPVTIIVDNVAAPAPTGGTGGTSSNTNTGSPGGGGGGGGGYVPVSSAALAISNVSAAGTAASGVTISWTTNSPSSGQVLYGPTASYGLQGTYDLALTSAHSAKISGLQPNASYHFKAVSKDSLGNTASTNDLILSIAWNGAVTLMTPVSGAASTNAPVNLQVPDIGVPMVAGSITGWFVLGTESSGVQTLQRILNASGYAVAASGSGSPGQESMYFGPATMAALKKFQCAKIYVCSGSPDTTGYGATGPKTRAALNAFAGGSSAVSAQNISTSVPAPALTPSVMPSGSVTAWLLLGMTDPQVAVLQKILNAKGFIVSVSGSGSPGHESAYFGPATDAALKRFQCAKIYVCSGSSDTTGYGATGPKTRAALSQM